MEIQTVIIELNNDDAEMFKFLQKHYNNIKRLKDSGIFDLRSKTAYLHIDQVGIIKNIDVKVRKL